MSGPKPREVNYPLRQPSDRLREAFKHLHLQPHFQEIEKDLRTELATLMARLTTEQNPEVLRQLQGQAQFAGIFIDLIDKAKETNK